jgi:hypothetical protein
MLTEAEMRSLTKGLPSKSAKMRALAKEGVPRADIARFLGTRYQFVRNVLEADAARGFAENPQAQYSAPAAPVLSHDEARRFFAYVENGLLVIPTEAVAAMKAREGDKVGILLEANSVHLRVASLRVLLERAQDGVSHLKRPGVSEVDELIAERRAEADRENRGE